MQPQNKVSERMIDGFSNFGEIIHRLEISFHRAARFFLLNTPKFKIYSRTISL